MVLFQIVHSDPGWCVQSRGFTWRFASCQDAMQFAVEMAEHYANASGRATEVRMQQADGSSEELRSYGGVVQLVDAVAQAMGARRQRGSDRIGQVPMR
jgi:hypothetical protein